jgi:hypothetical protein
MRDYAYSRNRYDFDHACLYARDAAAADGLCRMVFWAGTDDGYLVLPARDARADGRVSAPDYLAFFKANGRSHVRSWL